MRETGNVGNKSKQKVLIKDKNLYFTI